jgi:hypothetical protein
VRRRFKNVDSRRWFSSQIARLVLAGMGRQAATGGHRFKRIHICQCSGDYGLSQGSTVSEGSSDLHGLGNDATGGTYEYPFRP